MCEEKHKVKMPPSILVVNTCFFYGELTPTHNLFQKEIGYYYSYHHLTCKCLFDELLIIYYKLHFTNFIKLSNIHHNNIAVLCKDTSDKYKT